MSVTIENRCCQPATGSSPEMAFNVVVLPAPLVPISATSCPRADVEGDAFYRRHLAIAADKVPKLKHAFSPVQDRRG